MSHIDDRVPFKWYPQATKQDYEIGFYVDPRTYIKTLKVYKVLLADKTREEIPYTIDKSYKNISLSYIPGEKFGLLLVRNTPITNDLELHRETPFPSEDVDWVLDKIFMIEQEIKQEISDKATMDFGIVSTPAGRVEAKNYHDTLKLLEGKGIKLEIKDGGIAFNASIGFGDITGEIDDNAKLKSRFIGIDNRITDEVVRLDGRITSVHTELDNRITREVKALDDKKVNIADGKLEMACASHDADVLEGHAVYADSRNNIKLAKAEYMASMAQGIYTATNRILVFGDYQGILHLESGSPPPKEGDLLYLSAKEAGTLTVVPVIPVPQVVARYSTRTRIDPYAVDAPKHMLGNENESDTES
jgi:hypothetical protein